MRPRVFPAEDGQGDRRGEGALGASMRPRVFPAEDIEIATRQFVPIDASMRPRVFPAEDCGVAGAVGVRCFCFNEAAGIPRGRRTDFEETQGLGQLQ